MLVRPGTAVFHPATLFLLGAALSNALYQLLTRKLPNDTPYTTLFYTPLVGTAVLSLAVPFLGAAPASVSLGDALYLVELGLLAGFGHWAFITAFLMAPASLLAPFTYTQMIWATAYGYIIFDQLPDGLSALGMTIIVASGVGLVLHERRGIPPSVTETGKP